MKGELYWPHMASDVYKTVSICSEVARGATFLKLKRELQLSPASGKLEIVTFKILKLITSTVNGNQFITIIIDGYWKLTRAMTTGKTLSSHVANAFLDS